MGSHGRRGDAFGVNKVTRPADVVALKERRGAYWRVVLGSTPIRRSPESGPSSLLGFPPTRTAHPHPPA